MNLYSNEKAARDRMVDLQREMEFSRLLATEGLPRLVHLVRRAFRLADRRSRNSMPPATLRVISSDDDVASDVA